MLKILIDKMRVNSKIIHVDLIFFLVSLHFEGREYLLFKSISSYSLSYKTMDQNN